jgi:hypothetical protein
LTTFGLIGNSGDNDANFDSGKGGSVTLQLISGYVVQADGVVASGTIGPENAGSAAAADAALGGFEIFIFEDAELSGMTITLTSQLGQYVIQISDRQVDPNTDSGADDTLIAIDLDSLPGWDGTYITQVTVQDDDSSMSSGSCGRYGDTSMELDAVAMRTSALVQPASIGDYVWLDTDQDGIQDGTEGGINNVTVELYNSGNTLVGTTNTSGGGAYLFSGLTPGDYYVKFYLPTTNYTFSPQDQGGDDDLDSDADTSSGETALTTLSSGENDLSWDAGLYIPSTLVTLSSFGATVSDGRVVVQWSTSSGQNALGFYLERLDEQSGEFVRVNADLIPASIFSTGTVDYETVDADAVAGETYQYRLVELETTGKVNTYGPYTLSTEAPAGGAENDAGSTAVEQIEEAAPEVTGLTAGSGHMVLRWSSAEGNTYRIERSDSAGGEFEVIASGIPATAPENVLVLVDGADSGFYRIVSE